MQLLRKEELLLQTITGNSGYTKLGSTFSGWLVIRIQAAQAEQ